MIAEKALYQRQSACFKSALISGRKIVSRRWAQICCADDRRKSIINISGNLRVLNQR